MARLMSTDNGWRVVQLIPANEWFAWYKDEQHWYEPLVGWALVDTADNNRFVTGLVQTPEGIGFCDDSPHFVHYLHESEMPQSDA